MMHPRRELARGRTSGFALVISLLLMGFVLLLMLSISTLVQVELTTSGQRTSLDDARQNAYLGMMVALGELQKNAGVDQRVTARADILEDPDQTEEAVDASVLQPNWTGVWDSDGNLLTWLVSGNGNQQPSDNDFYGPEDNLSSDRRVQLVAGQMIDADVGSVDVYAPLVDVPDREGNSPGSFAYWVGDEGVKAKANYRTVSLETEAALPSNAKLMTPRQLGVGSTLGMSWFDEIAQNRFELLYNDTSLHLLAAGSATAEQAIAGHFDDLTVWSYGVLADVANGGLKKDLTAGLFHDSGSDDLTGSIFEPSEGETASLSNPGGPDWAQLRSWATTTASGGSLPVRESTNTQAGFYPIISQAQLFFMPVYKADEENKIYIYLMPAVTLWNPYDEPLEEASYNVTFAQNIMTNTGGGKTAKKRTPLWLFNLDADVDGPNDRFKVAPEDGIITLTIPNVRLEPGEAKVFSPPSGKHAYTWDDSPAVGVNELIEGYRDGAVFYSVVDGEESLSYDTDGVTPLNDYYWTAGNTSVMALFLYKVDGPGLGGLEPLQDVTFLRSSSTATSSRPMFEFTHDLSTSELNNEVIGFKFTRAFSDNTASYTPIGGEQSGSDIVFSGVNGEVKWLSSLNPRAVMSGGAGRTFTDVAARNVSFYNQFFVDGDERSIASSSNGKAYVGHDEGGYSVSETVLYEASMGRDGLWSIGQFMHAPLFRWEPSGVADYSNFDDRSYGRELNMRYDNLIPAYAVGNSDASPFIPDLANTSQLIKYRPADSGDAGRFLNEVYRYDYSYLLNEALWDQYFLSTLPDDVLAGTEAANPRLVRHTDDSEFSIGLDDTAQYLMLDGAFNVNSTSVEAWKALLSSYFELPVTLRSGVEVENDNAVPFLRTGQPVGSGATEGDDPDAQNAYNGYRTLSLDQVESLATEIVRQIRLRGPFTSLADFVNRSVDASDDALRLRGALAEAINLAEVNEGMQVIEAKSLDLNENWVNSDAEVGWTNEQVPGWFSQADIMSRLGSVLSARSDTFRVRSYGASSSLDGATASEAWCEAIVQRVPEYVDSSDLPSADPSDTNLEFGRRFVIVSFRWLTKDEI